MGSGKKPCPGKVQPRPPGPVPTGTHRFVPWLAAHTPFCPCSASKGAQGTAAGSTGVNSGAAQVEVEAPSPLLHLPGFRGHRKVEAAVALCLPALGVKEPARNLHLRGSGQKSAAAKWGSVALSTAGAVSASRGGGEKRERRAGEQSASGPPRGPGSDLFGCPRCRGGRWVPTRRMAA